MLIKGMKEEGKFKIFLCYPKGLGTSHKSFCKQGGIISACEVFVSD